MHKRVQSTPTNLQQFSNGNSIASPIFTCTCSVCDLYQVNESLPSKPLESIDLIFHQISQTVKNPKFADYSWLLLQLAESKTPIKGLKISDALLWEKGKPAYIIKSLPNNKIIKITHEHMTKEYARKLFTIERRGSITKEIKKVKNRGGSLKLCVIDPIEITKINYKAVLRQYDPPTDKKNLRLTLLTDKALGEIFTMWTYEHLKSVRSIHAFIKLIGRNPQVIRINYFMNGSTSIPIDNPMASRCKDYTKKIIECIENHGKYKIHALISEFFTTDREIWLNNVENIIFTEIDQPDLTSTIEMLEKEKKVNDLMQKGTVKRLRKYEKAISKQKISLIENVAYTIDNRVEDIKEFSGVSETLRTKKKKELSNIAFTKLRPKSQYPISTVLSPNFTPEKYANLQKKPGLCKNNKNELIQELLYNKPIKHIPKLELTKSEYISTVRESLRIIHHAIPHSSKDKKGITYDEFKKSVKKLQNVLDKQNAIKSLTFESKYGTIDNSTAWSKTTGMISPEKYKPDLLLFYKKKMKSR